jgi:hypothetical protein
MSPPCSSTVKMEVIVVSKIAKLVVLLVIAGMFAMDATPSEARGWRRGGYYGYGGGALIGGAVLGAALSRPYYGYGYAPYAYDPYYYSPYAYGSYYDPYYYGYPYRTRYYRTWRRW